jgi:diguanylate cyclase (GGDEF)-like protein
MFGNKHLPSEKTIIATPADNVSALKRLSSREVQLWSIGLLVMLVLVSGILSFLSSNVIATLHIQTRYIPQLSLGLIALVLLLNFYLIEQRRNLDRERQRLVRQITYDETVDKLAVLDPVTHVFNRRYLDELLTRELREANRQDTPITLLMVQHAPFDVLVTRHGRTTAEQFAAHVAHLLQRNFRGQDAVVRYAESQFVVVMPETSAELARFAFQRLNELVDDWNRDSDFPCEMGLQFAHREYACGMDAWGLIENMARYLKSQTSLIPRLRSAENGTTVSPAIMFAARETRLS